MGHPVELAPGHLHVVLVLVLKEHLPRLDACRSGQPEFCGRDGVAVVSGPAVDAVGDVLLEPGRFALEFPAAGWVVHAEGGGTSGESRRVVAGFLDPVRSAVVVDRRTVGRRWAAPGKHDEQVTLRVDADPASPLAITEQPAMRTAIATADKPRRQRMR